MRRCALQNERRRAATVDRNGETLHVLPRDIDADLAENGLRAQHCAGLAVALDRAAGVKVVGAGRDALETKGAVGSEALRGYRKQRLVHRGERDGVHFPGGLRAAPLTLKSAAGATRKSVLA